jgi:hypothetical protein
MKLSIFADTKMQKPFRVLVINQLILGCVGGFSRKPTGLFYCLTFLRLVVIATTEKASARLGAKNRASLAETPHVNEIKLGMGLSYGAGNRWARLRWKTIIPVMRDLVFACLVLQRWNEEGSSLDYLHH